MKKIADSRKLLGTLPSATLQDLSARYKTLMKQHHPDKFTDEKEKAEAEAYSKHLTMRTTSGEHCTGDACSNTRKTLTTGNWSDHGLAYSPDAEAALWGRTEYEYYPYQRMSTTSSSTIKAACVLHAGISVVHSHAEACKKSAEEQSSTMQRLIVREKITAYCTKIYWQRDK